VFDVGANIGQSVEIVRLNSPNATIHAFEPVEASFQCLQASVEGCSNVHCHRLALGNSNTIVQITNNSTNTDNCVADQPGRDTESVQMVQGDTFCAENAVNAISYLKIDTEGYDLKVLHGFHRMISTHTIDLIQIEAGINPLNKTHVPLNDFRGYLEPLGYYLFGMFGWKIERTRPYGRLTNPVFISTTLAENMPASSRKREGIRA
jgi:FkbM family methyltransferase